MIPPNLHLCFVTEVDLTKIGGAVTTDQRMIHCLSKLGSVNVVYMQKTRFKSMTLALLVFMFMLLKNLSKHHKVYFSRGLFPSTILLLLRPFGHYKILHHALSVPLPSREVYFLPHSVFETIIRYHFFRFLERYTLPKVDGIIVASPEYQDILADFGVEKTKIQVIPFTVEDAFFKQPLKEELGEIFSFCYAGRFHLYHVLVPLVQAFELAVQKGVNAELLLVGDGPLRSQVDKEAAHRNLLSKVKFTGMIPHDAFPSFLSKVDCFVLMSRAPGMPIGILEAAAAAKAIVTLNRKNDEALRRYFTHEKDIYLVETCSPTQIANAMQVLYEDSQLRRTLAQGARKVAVQHFSEQAVVPKLQGIINKELGASF